MSRQTDLDPLQMFPQQWEKNIPIYGWNSIREREVENKGKITFKELFLSFNRKSVKLGS